MAEKKVVIYSPLNNKIHPETKAEVVLITDLNNNYSSSNVEGALDEIGSKISNVYTILSDTNEPTGFLDRNAILAFNSTTREFTITGDINYYYKGFKYFKVNDTYTISNSVGMHFLYYDNDSIIKDAATFPGMSVALIAFVYWNGTQGNLADERHGVVMDAATHQYLYETEGARYHSGLSATFTNNTFSIGVGAIRDENNLHNITTQTTSDVYYKNGSVNWIWNENQTKYYHDNGTNIYYNNGNALATVASNEYVAYWIFATNSTTRPIISLMGQRVDTTITQARENNRYENLVFGEFPFKKIKILYRVLLRGNRTYAEAQDLRSIAAGGTGTYVATSHDTLTGILGGGTYHLSETQHTDLTDGGDTTLHTHDGRYYTETEIDTKFTNDAAPKVHSHAISDVTNLQTTLNGLQVTSEKGQVNGYASLGGDGKVPSAQLPSFVDDAVEYAALANFPATGETGKIYIALDTNKVYRWSGTVYVYITSGAVDSVAGKTGVVTLTKADVGLSNVDNTADSTKSVASAATLTTGRTINGTSFNGSANITTANWGTSRTITIGSTGKAVDGSGDVSWSLAEIGARAAGAIPATDTTITDAGGYYTGTNVEDTLQEIANHLVVKAPLFSPNFSGYPTIEGNLIVTSTNGTIDYYVSPTGSNSNNGSSGSPFLTIGYAISQIPKILRHPVTINVAPGTYAENIIIDGFTGVQKISLKGGANSTEALNYIVNRITLENNTVEVYVRGFKSISTSWHSFDVNNCTKFSFYSCVTTDATAVYHGFNVSSSNGYIYDCVAGSKKYALMSYSNSNVFSYSWDSGSTGNEVGLYASEGGTIYTSGAQPSGTTNTTVAFAGVITGSVINPAPLASPTFTGTVVLPSTTSIGSVSSTEIGYLDGVTSNIQTQLNDKAAGNHTHGNITNAGAIGTTAGLMVKTTTSGVLTTLAAGTDGQFLTYDGTWATPPDTNTTYTAGNGLTLTGTTFDVVSAAGTAGSVGTLTVTADAVGVSLGTTSTTAAAGNHTHSYLPLSGGTLTGTLIFGNGTSPNTNTIQFGDNSGWNLRFMTNVSGTPTTRFTFADNGNFTAVGNITAYSDERLKSNIQTIPNALDKVMSMRGVEFDKDGKHSIGVIAQEVQKIIPEVVLEGEYLSVAYGNLVGLLIEAIKDQQKQIDELRSKVGI